MSPNVSYTWIKDGVELKSGKEYCCIRVDAEGKYSVVVKNGETVETSEFIHIKNASAGIKGSNKDESCKLSVPNNLPIHHVDDEAHAPNLPMIRKSDFVISADGEIGRGTFGTVFKGEWARTPVAIKRIKVRRPNMIQSALNSEVRIHSMLRHPNIVQIMAVAMEKNELFIISEFVDGSNLEDLLFSSDEVHLLPTTKNSIALQCAQAVAYLHALNPPVIHRDIKPANVLVSRINHAVKICDMGISRIKAIQTMYQSSVSGIPGTPSYMAPECLLNKEKATIHSDIWSLGCTLLEMYTEKECWEIEDDTQLGTASNACSGFMRHLNNKEIPSSLESSDIDIVIKEILRRCFDYVPEKRPNALQLVIVFKR
jgi:serine/threonine protein kinase